MKVFLLDVAAGSELVALSTGVLVFMLLCILSEALVIWLLKTAPTFGKSFLYSAIANVVTMVIGFLAVPPFEDKFHGLEEGLRLLIYFSASVLIETIILRQLVKAKPFSKIVLTSVVMNLVSYGIIYLLLKFTQLGA